MTGPTSPLLRRLALATIVANLTIVVTGGAVRLTGSGLGCPTWPRCSAHSLVPTGELDYHSQIEFTNRMITYLVGGVALATLIVAHRARPARRDIRRLALVLFLGVPAQAVLGGITVLTDLNPWVVMFHLLLSMGLIGLATLLWVRLAETDGPSLSVVAPAVRRTGMALLAVVAAVLYLGTVVTGSGPHAGDAHAPRTGLDPRLAAQLHADAVLLLVGLTIATAVALTATGAPPASRRAASVLIGIELTQGAIGYVQYFTGLPEVLVGLHMLGAGLLVIAATRLTLSLRIRLPEASAEQHRVDRDHREQQREIAVGQVEQPHR